MTNDTSTLNGALQELGETMANNLEAKGVTASASDGLTTLANKILTIQASCYHIEFSEASYVAIGGTATLEIYLQENYAPKANATVSVVGSDSSLYTGITNNEGVATIIVTGLTTETIFTATYSNVSASSIVNIQTVLFYDGGVTGDKNSDWIIKNTVSINTNSTGTKITSSNRTDNHNYYVADILLQGDFELEFTLVQGHWWDYFLCFLDTSYNIFTAFAFASFSNGGAYGGSSMNSNSKLLTTTHSYPVTVKVKRIDSTFTFYENDVRLGAYTSNSNDCYFAFGITSDASRYTTYRDLTITKL